MSAASESLSLQSATGAAASPRSSMALQAIIFLAAFALLVSHRTDAIFGAQFYAEDGKYFYSHAYQFGWRCIFVPYGGSLYILLRLIGLFAQLFPFAVAPLVMNICALTVQILPVNLFLSNRFSTIPFYTRVLGSFMYLALPNSSEIHANTTNIQWHLALIAVLIVLSQADSASAWRFFDYPVLLLAILAAYANHFHNSFHFDDKHTIVNNASIRELRNIPLFFRDATTFSSLPSNQSYRPLVSTLVAIPSGIRSRLPDHFSFFRRSAIFRLKIHCRRPRTSR